MPYLREVPPLCVPSSLRIKIIKSLNTCVKSFSLAVTISIQSSLVSSSEHSRYFLLFFTILSAHCLINSSISRICMTFTGSLSSCGSRSNCLKISSLNFIQRFSPLFLPIFSGIPAENSQAFLENSL